MVGHGSSKGGGVAADGHMRWKRGEGSEPELNETNESFKHEALAEARKTFASKVIVKVYQGVHCFVQLLAW